MYTKQNPVILNEEQRSEESLHEAKYFNFTTSQFPMVLKNRCFKKKVKFKKYYLYPVMDKKIPNCKAGKLVLASLFFGFNTN